MSEEWLDKVWNLWYKLQILEEHLGKLGKDIEAFEKRNMVVLV